MGWVWIRVHAFYFQFHLEDILLIQIFSDKDFCAFFARFPHCSDMDFCAALTCSFYLASASASSSLLDIPSLTSYIIILFSFQDKNVCFLFTTYNLQLFYDMLSLSFRSNQRTSIKFKFSQKANLILESVLVSKL